LVAMLTPTNVSVKIICAGHWSDE